MKCEKPMIRVESITTKFGTAKIVDRGYWRITSSKEGNLRKYLHRLFFEDYHKCTLLPNAVIHHKDGNKLNNRYKNLELMSQEEHLSLHHKGSKRSDEFKQKISKSKNTSGYLNVCKRRDPKCKQGFTWSYRYYDEDGKRIELSSVDINKLEEKVKARGLKWLKLND